MIGLETLERNSQIAGACLQHGFDIAKAGRSVDFGFPFSESSEVRSVQDKDALGLHAKSMQVLCSIINPNVS